MAGHLDPIPNITRSTPRRLSSRNNVTDVVGREFRIKRLDNLVASLLVGNSIGATVNLSKNYVE